MEYVIKMLSEPGVASTLAFLCIVAFIGILLGKIKIFNIRLGIAGVLFTGLLIGHLGAKVEIEILHFARELGLILFVFTIGLEVGPRFFNSFRNSGLKMNLMAAAIVFGGFGIAMGIKYIYDLPAGTAVGIMCGAVTNTPSLGAAQQLLNDQGGIYAAQVPVAGMAYAVAYPFGILGIILTMLLVRYIFKVKIQSEIEEYNKMITYGLDNIKSVYCRITNPNMHGKDFKWFRKSMDDKIVVSRIKRHDNYIVPNDNTRLEVNDVLYGVSTESSIPSLEFIVGETKIQEKLEITGEMGIKHVMVTKKKFAGKTIEELGIHYRYPATITRIFRGETEIMPSGSDTIEFGDTVKIVGKREALSDIAKELGNSVHELAHPNTVPIFIGILLGIIVGSIPIFIPGLPAPAKFGLAGGPLLIALIMGFKGRIGKMDFYMTPGANYMLRELGIILFLASVGILSGKNFVSTLQSGGYVWMLYGAAITFIPIFIYGIIARLFLKYNYLTICGIVAGSLTDPPALEYANTIAKSQAQSTAYATVYPVTMFLRIIVAQILVLTAM